MDRNRDLFWKLVEPEHVRARAYCRKLMNNRDDGDDLYQDSLVCALTGFANLRDTRVFRPWLYRIIINTFKNRVKSPWWKRVVPLTAKVAEVVPGDDPTVRRAARRCLEIALRSLSPHDRALVVLHELQGWTIDELAALRDRSPGSIRVRLSRARNRIRRALIRHYQRSASTSNHKSFQSEETVCVVTKSAED